MQLVAAGRVQALSCLVGAPDWGDAARAAQDLPGERVDLGLHLDLCDHPLAPEGPRRWSLLVSASLLRRLDRHRLRAQIDMQLDRFESALGRAPAFVDGHRHVHQLPAVREALLDALCARYPRARPWLRHTARPSAPNPSGQAQAVAHFKPWLIEKLGSKELHRLALRCGYAQNAHLLGVYDFDATVMAYLGLLDGWLQQAVQGDLLMCHPASRPGGDPLDAARCREFEALASDAFASLVMAGRVRLVPMSRLLRSASAPARARGEAS